MSLDDKDYLEARFLDAVRQCDLRNTPKFVGFLSQFQSALAQKVAINENAKFMLFGGHSEAERVYFGVFPEWCEQAEDMFPISRLKIYNKSNKPFTHRDVLGAILALGLERDVVGDIVVGDKESFVFVNRSVSEYISEQLFKIGSAGVEVCLDNDSPMLEKTTFLEKSATIASARLDCVVSALCNLSRTSSAELITSGLVLVGGLEVNKPTAQVMSGNVISIRRQGKFIVDAISDKTKKGRTVLKYRKYI